MLSASHETGELSLESMIESIRGYLPQQAPLQVFVHHNTLHHFEHLPFLQGVEEAAQIYGARPYLSEADYRDAFSKGRITDADLITVIRQTRPSFPLTELIDEEDIRCLLVADEEIISKDLVLWHLLEAREIENPSHKVYLGRWEGAVAKERARLSSLNPAQRKALISSLVVRHHHWGDDDENIVIRITSALTRPIKNVESSLSVGLLWLTCLRQARWWMPASTAIARSLSDQERAQVSARAVLVPYLSKLVASFLDQGFALWSLPHRNRGFFKAVINHLEVSTPMRPWFLKDIKKGLALLKEKGAHAYVEEILSSLVTPKEKKECLRQHALSMKGWAGFMSLIEKRPDITSLPSTARKDALIEFLAIKIFLEKHVSRLVEGSIINRVTFSHEFTPRALDKLYSLAYHLFRWCQMRGVTGTDFIESSSERILALKDLFLSTSAITKRRTWHLAFEHNLEKRAYNAFLGSAEHPIENSHAPRFQLMFCIDDREESLRRYLEEMGPHIETFGTAGFFGLAVEYRDLAGESTPYCPQDTKPKQGIQEIVREEHSQVVDRLQKVRSALSHSTEIIHANSRTAFSGWLLSLLGSAAALPLIIKVLLPRLSRQLERKVLKIDDVSVSSVVYEQTTSSAIDSVDADEASADALNGFTIDEMIDRVAALLKSIGLLHSFAPVVALLGHGSSSKNNPFRSAYDCGACGGRPGKVNARVFALMANRSEVRLGLYNKHSIHIPDSTIFFGGYHDTCNDSVLFFDLDKIPSAHQDLCNELVLILDAARKLNAKERVRRFGYHGEMTPENALRFVEARSHHIAEPRPEYGHATNALCCIGRRSLTRGLFLDRRAFLLSYDPKTDDSATILQGILSAVIPVCMGINLEYFFSSVDNTVYGAGTKLPLNIASMIGAITGYASDLRTGLPAQMVEIHEPSRLIVIIDASISQIEKTFSAIPRLESIFKNGWIIGAVYQAEENKLYKITPDGFVLWALDESLIDEVPDLQSWLKPHINLPFISVHQAGRQ